MEFEREIVDRMQPLRVISPAFKLLAEIDTYTSLQWVRRWHKPGGFELHINPQMQGADALQIGNIVFRATDKTEAAIIEYRQIELADNGSETLTVRGSFLGSILARRITVPPVNMAYDYANGPAESIMHQYVANNCIAPADSARTLPHLTASTNLGRGDTMAYQTRYKPLADELEVLSIVSGLGWQVRLDLLEQRYVFDVRVGRDLTLGQTALPPVVFAPDFDNVRGQILTVSIIGHKNMAYVGGQGEGAERQIAEVRGELSGLDRYEVFVDARDMDTEQSLIDRGVQRLAELGKVETFEAQILPSSHLAYRHDWDLGDVVTIRNRAWGASLDARITEVREVIEQQGLQIEAVFGNQQPTLIDAIKRQLR